MRKYKKLIQKTLALFMSVSLVSANFSTSVLAEEETNEDAVQTEEAQEEVTGETVVSEEGEQETEEPVVSEEENTEETEAAAEVTEETVETFSEEAEEKEAAEPASEEEEVIDASEEKTEEQMNVTPDETGAYNLWVCGVRVTDENKQDILNDGGSAEFFLNTIICF